MSDSSCLTVLHRETGKEISTLRNSEQLARNRYYMSAIINMLELLVVNQLRLCEDIAGFAIMLDDNSSVGPFMSSSTPFTKIQKDYANNPTECTLYQPTDTKQDY